MKLKNVFSLWMCCAAMTACHPGGAALSSRDGGAGPGKTAPPPVVQKPDPTSGKIIEKIVALQLQKPTTNESEFLNNMELDFGDAEKALFSFSYAPDADGLLYFSLQQSRLHLNGCTKTSDHKYKMNIFWQENLGTKREVLEVFTPSITGFHFKSGHKYILSYTLLDLKNDLPDCKSATLNFAAFLQNY